MKGEVHRAFGLWITGLPASGKSTVTAALTKQLREAGMDITVLESDRMRMVFSDNPQYDERSYRNRARKHISRFVEVFVDCPLQVCASRDPKGIYRMAREGKASNVPGLQASYEPPENPDIVIHADREEPLEAARRIMEMLTDRGFLSKT